jgi:putative transposase
MNRKAYPSDLSDSEWSIIKPLLPKAKKQGRGRKREIDEREIVNAILYLLQEGCQWRSLPQDFPHWSTVRTYFDRWKRKKVWNRLNEILREELKILEGRERKPSAASIDSQSVKTTQKSAPPALRFPQRKDGASRGIWL